MDEIRSTRAPRLRTDQIELLKRYGETRRTEVGEVLFRAGDTDNDFVVVLEGEVKVGDDFPGESRTIGTFREGRFLGELNMLTGQAIVHDEGGPWPQDHRLAPLGRRDAPEGVRGPQPGTPRLGRAGGRPEGRRPAREVGREAVGDARDRLAGRGCAEKPDEPRVCPYHRPGGGRPPATDLRPRRGRRRTGWPRRVGLRGLRGPRYPRTRVGRSWRPGGHELAHKELT